MAEKAVCTANFAPFLDFFGKSFSISASSQVPWVQHGFALTSALPPTGGSGFQSRHSRRFLIGKLCQARALSIIESQIPFDFRMSSTVSRIAPWPAGALVV